MSFNDFVERWLDPYRGLPNYYLFKEFAEYAKTQYKYPFSSAEEAWFILAVNSPDYSVSGIKKLYRDIKEDRQSRMVEFFYKPVEEFLI
jgi:hypothetical protein